MRPRSTLAILTFGLAISLATSLASPTPALADSSNDLVLSRFGVQIPSGNDFKTVGQNLEFRSLVSELGVALAPCRVR